ncbi:MAG TPA: hypothetical protein VNZ86_12200, partial [Bacteroidia bacterium]|nr:hypothetical protein [Bacteroidia bacterium]
ENSLSMQALALQISNYYGVSISYTGVDPLEEERWNLSAAKARKELHFNPELDSDSVVEALLMNSK